MVKNVQKFIRRISGDNINIKGKPGKVN